MLVMWLKCLKSSVNDLSQGFREVGWGHSQADCPSDILVPACPLSYASKVAQKSKQEHSYLYAPMVVRGYTQLMRVNVTFF